MKKNITVYHPKYLPLSETFIYRQMKGLSQYFNLKVIARSIVNSEEYPDINPLIAPPRNILSRLCGAERRFFDDQLKGSDLIHVNFGVIAVQMEEVASRLGIPLTAYFLGHDASSALKNVDYCRKLKESKFTAVFVNSEDMKKRLIPYLPSNMQCNVVYCGIPMDRFPFRHRCSVPDGATFLQISRLTAKKGIEFTLKAFRRYVSETDPKSRLIIAGDGPLKEKLQALTDALALRGNVSFTGDVRYQQYIELLQNADAFVHPSVTAEDGDMEGIPTVICEAMASGLPVVATRHSGIPELIDAGEDGLLVAERDVDGLFESMAALRTSDIGAMSRNARIKVEMKFDHARTIVELANHLSTIIG